MTTTPTIEIRLNHDTGEWEATANGPGPAEWSPIEWDDPATGLESLADAEWTLYTGEGAETQQGAAQDVSGADFDTPMSLAPPWVWFALLVALILWSWACAWLGNIAGYDEGFEVGRREGRKSFGGKES